MANILRLVSVGGALAIVLSVIVLGVIGTPIEARGGPITGDAVMPKVSGGYQEVALTFRNYEYHLEPETLVAGVPVRMTVDLDSVYGCMRDVVIPSAGVRKYVREGDEVIEFTPEKAGTFNIRCSMNMGRGTFEVVEPDGSAASFVEAEESVPAGDSCGAASGGDCGCGGYS